MTTIDTKKLKKTTKALQALQLEHQVAIKKVTTVRQKLSKRTTQLQKLESEMTDLENQLHILRHPEDSELITPVKTMRPARLIFNPNSIPATGHKKNTQNVSLETIVTTLRAHGISPEVFVKTSGRVAREYAREAVTNKEELIIVAGGDGTIEDVATQLVGSSTVLGVIPLGTMNNLARSLGIPLELEQACALMGTGITRQIDMGRVEAEEDAHPEYFLESSGIGLALVWPTGQNLKKRRWGKLISQFAHLFDQGKGTIYLELADGQKIAAHSRLITVSNAPLFGLNSRIAPEAKMDDGLFDVATYENMSVVNLTHYFLKTVNDKKAQHPKVRFYRTSGLRISSPERVAAIADKDPIPDKKELEIKIIPGALTMIVGPGAALSWPVEGPAPSAQAGEAGRANNGHKNGTATQLQPVPTHSESHA